MTDTNQATLDLLASDGYNTNLVHIGAIFDDGHARKFLPDNHVRQVRIDSIGKTVTGWQVRVDEYHGPLPADWNDVNDGMLYLDTLLAGYQPVAEEPR